MSALGAALGVLLALAFLTGIVVVVGMLAFAGRRRAIHRGTHPLRLLPWYLGGPPEVTPLPPAENRSERRRRSEHRGD